MAWTQTSAQPRTNLGATSAARARSEAADGQIRAVCYLFSFVLVLGSEISAVFSRIGDRHRVGGVRTVTPPLRVEMQMAEFKIEIEPPLAESAGTRTSFGDISLKYKEISEAFRDQFQIIYHTSGKKFKYHPTDIFNVFADILDELDHFQAAKSHFVTMVGYTVAYARCKSGRVWFYIPPREFGSEDQVELEGEGIPLHLVIEAFERAANAVCDFIESKVKLDA